MNKKYIIIIVLCILVGVGYNVYKKRSKTEETVNRNEKEHSRIAEMANKSPKAGLSEMGRALEKYYEENKSYPPKLSDLYPKYMANKHLVDKVAWEYSPGKDNFALAKAILVDGQKTFASIDNTLKPSMGEKILVASAKEVPVSAQQQYVMPGISDIVAKIDSESTKVEKIIQTRLIEPEFALIRETESDRDFENEMSRKFLVWKDEKGVMGFGNVQYPQTSRLSVFSDGKRFDLQRPSRSYKIFDEERVEYKRDLDAVALEHGKEYLVWKNRNGSLGFGNLQYPDNNDVVYINVGGTWRKRGG